MRSARIRLSGVIALHSVHELLHLFGPHLPAPVHTCLARYGLYSRSISTENGSLLSAGLLHISHGSLDY